MQDAAKDRNDNNTMDKIDGFHTAPTFSDDALLDDLMEDIGEETDDSGKTGQSKGNKKKTGDGRFSSELFSWGESLMVVLIFFVILFTFFIRLIGVDGSSMYPTLKDKDIMLVSNLLYSPQKGDIVVLNKSEFWNNRPIVKRVIATGGDTIDIDVTTGDVLVNGKALNEPYINEKIDPLKSLGTMQYPATVPEGCIFVMGDNRNYSSDSRSIDLGMVDERYILGHVLRVIYPFEDFGAIE